MYCEVCGKVKDDIVVIVDDMCMQVDEKGCVCLDCCEECFMYPCEIYHSEQAHAPDKKS